MNQIPIRMLGYIVFSSIISDTTVNRNIGEFDAEIA